MPSQDLLPDQLNERTVNGVAVRKGTVGAFFINARIFSDLTFSAEARSDAEREIIESLPALQALGLFEVMQIRDNTLRILIEENIKADE